MITMTPEEHDRVFGKNPSQFTTTLEDRLASIETALAELREMVSTLLPKPMARWAGKPVTLDEFYRLKSEWIAERRRADGAE